MSVKLKATLPHVGVLTQKRYSLHQCRKSLYRGCCCFRAADPRRGGGVTRIARPPPTQLPRDAQASAFQPLPVGGLPGYPPAQVVRSPDPDPSYHTASLKYNLPGHVSVPSQQLAEIE